ncbi:MAG: ion channel [Candidatus Peregrinibacteria bacterium]
MEPENNEIKQSLLLSILSRIVEWGNNWLTLSHWLIRGNRHIFIKLEILMLVIVVFCVTLLCVIDRLPYTVALVLSIILIQRVLEFLIVYSRNFILRRGRIFSDFTDEETRGQWLLIMFSLNVIQIITIFAIWYHLISEVNPAAFSLSLDALNSLYFSITTFFTIGYGDIVPLAVLPKALIMVQNALTFYTIVIVVNGVVTIHFKRQ